MGMDKSTYIGPFAKCIGPKNGGPDRWVCEEEGFGERLYYANGGGIDSPALFAPNVNYDGKADFTKTVEDGGFLEFRLLPSDVYIQAFLVAFANEIAILRDYFTEVELVFGVIVAWS